MTKADTGMRLRVLDREADARARVERRHRARQAVAAQVERPTEAERLARMRLRHQADAFSAAVNRPTPERLERAGGAYVDLATRSAGVVRMLDESDGDRQRMRALPRVNRWAAETLRRVYLLAHREPCVTASYGANRRPGELPEHVAYAEVLVARCRRQAGRHWPVLRAALVDDAWRIKDERALRFALRWLAGWWWRVEVTEGAAWEDLATELSLRVEGEGERAALTPWHEWLMLACGDEGLPVREVPRFADEIGADVLAVMAQLSAWRCQGLVWRRDGVWRVAW